MNTGAIEGVIILLCIKSISSCVSNHSKVSCISLSLIYMFFEYFCLCRTGHVISELSNGILACCLILVGIVVVLSYFLCSKAVDQRYW